MNTDLVPQDDRAYLVPRSEVYLNPAKFEQMQRVAKMFADSDMVPDHFKGKISNCFIAINEALRHNLDPALYMQKTYIIGGKPAIESQLAIALLQSSGLITGTIDYKMSGEGKSRACEATVWDAKTGEARSHELDMKTVEASGWTGKPNSYWKKDPDLMLRYRAVIRLARLYYPHVLMGMQTREEILDTIDAEVVSRGDKKISQPVRPMAPIDVIVKAKANHAESSRPDKLPAGTASAIVHADAEESSVPSDSGGKDSVLFDTEPTPEEIEEIRRKESF